MVEHAAKTNKNHSQDPFLLRCDNAFVRALMEDAGLHQHMPNALTEFDRQRRSKQDAKNYLAQLKSSISRLRVRYRKAGKGTKTAGDLYGYCLSATAGDR